MNDNSEKTNSNKTLQNAPLSTQSNVYYARQIRRKKLLTICTVCVTAILLTVLCSIVSYGIGYDAKMNESIMDERREMDEEIQQKENKLDKLKDEISKNDSTLTEIEKFNADKVLLQGNIGNLRNELSNLKKEVEDKKSELLTLTKAVEDAKAEPKTLPAGNFVVGKDIQPGRYSVSGRSNFVVHSSSGKLKVNTILGGLYGVESYVCELITGDQIEANGSDTFTPIN